MLILLALPAIVAVAAIHRYVNLFAPMNLLVRRARAQQPRWGTAAILAMIAVSLLAAMRAVADAVSNGAPGWLNLVVLIFAWDAIKVGLSALELVVRCLLSVLPHLRPTRLAS